MKLSPRKNSLYVKAEDLESVYKTSLKKQGVGGWEEVQIVQWRQEENNEEPESGGIRSE